jgi:hypothetical protein
VISGAGQENQSSRLASSLCFYSGNSAGLLEQRLASAGNMTWLISTPKGTQEHSILERIIDKRLDEFEKDVNAS